MQYYNIKSLLSSKSEIKNISTKGWVRNKRGSKNIFFIELNDGSILSGIQIIVEQNTEKEEIIKMVSVGSSIHVEGELVKSLGKKQKFEILAKKIQIIGKSDPEKYPLQPKKHSLEFLREIAHLRVRTNTFNCVFKIRHEISLAIHNFFHNNGFYYVNTPIITSADAEGAGEMFRVTTSDKQNYNDFKKDFFSKKSNLTVSGQLEAELMALGLSKVYTFGPTFRAENSNTSRHLSEFWMIEPEVAFADLNENTKLAEDLLKYCIEKVITNKSEELDFLNNRFSKEEQQLKEQERSDLGLIERLEFVVNNNFETVSYSDAFDILKKSKPNKKKKFNFLVENWGMDFQSEHEKYLVEKVFKKPVTVINYPKEIKAFYMRLNDDQKTVRAMDVLFPQVGEIIGGSQREERKVILKQRMKELEIEEEDLWWYLETREFGTVPHSGFGLGLERLVQFVTGMKNIRDVIPFPRTPSNLEF